MNEMGINVHIWGLRLGCDEVNSDLMTKCKSPAVPGKKWNSIDGSNKKSGFLRLDQLSSMFSDNIEHDFERSVLPEVQ